MHKKYFDKLFFQFLLAVSVTALGGSCESPKKINEEYLYFQKNLDHLNERPLKERLVQISDLLSIQVLSNSLNQEQTMLFSLSNNTNGSTVNTSIIPTYLVNTAGDIEMPVMGYIKAVGLTKDQLQVNIVDKISAYVKNPIVIIRFSDFKVNVLGEVKTPGIQSFHKDNVTVIDAISAAGDLTDYAKREDIIIIREEAGNRKNYSIDLRDGSLFQSPAYQLQPNDIIYVGANAKKMKSLKNSSYNQKGIQIFLGVASITTALIYLISTIARNN
jgi:polysaccharide export outer membrane protein